MATTNFKIKNGLLSKRYLQSKSAISVSAVDDQTVGTMTSSILQTTGDNSSWVQKTDRYFFVWWSYCKISVSLRYDRK